MTIGLPPGFDKTYSGEANSVDKNELHLTDDFATNTTSFLLLSCILTLSNPCSVPSLCYPILVLLSYHPCAVLSVIFYPCAVPSLCCLIGVLSHRCAV